MDFETYSEAGFEWDESTQKYRGPEGASQNKKGLPVIGAAKYSEHPSTEVLTLKYDVGQGMKFWRPGMPNPVDLFAVPVVEAWNSAFEYWIWNNVCVPKYGWPARPIEGFYDAMAKSRAHSLPGALSDAAAVLGAAVQKDKDGDRLLKKFSMPRNPTKGDPRRRIPLVWDEDQAGAEVAKLMALGLKEKAATDLVQEDRVDTLKLVSYNETDVLAERSVGEMVPDLSRHEFPIWLTDQHINRRGIAIDRDGVDNCIAIIQQASERYGQELLQLAGCRPTELQKLSGWLHGRGVRMDSMEEEAIEAALGWDLPPDARRALEIRAAVGSASVKKVFSMRNMMSAAGRLHDLYTFHGAHSGRPTGSGPQPTNLPKAGPHVWKCAACGHQHNAQGNQCPWCFTAFDRMSKRREWNPEAVEDALLVLRSRSLAAVEFFFSEAMQTVAGVLRGLFVAKPGHKLVSSDFSSIESVVIAALAGEEWRLDVFRTHGKIYETAAAKMLGVPLQELLDYKTQHGVHHPARQQLGKPGELACLGGSTKVLTRSGWKRLDSVDTSDEVHDGVEFVRHRGLLKRGKRLVRMVAGVAATPDHQFLAGDETWKRTDDLVGSTHYLKLAIGLADSLLQKYFGNQPAGCPVSYAYVNAGGSAESTFTTCSKAHLRSATPVVKQAPLSQDANMTGQCRKTRIAPDFSIEFTQQSVDALTPSTFSTPLTAGAASPSIQRGCSTTDFGFHTYAPYPDGMTRMRPATASTMTAGMNQVTCDSYPTESSKVTSSKLFGSNSLVSVCQVQSSIKGSAQGTYAPAQCYESLKKENPHSKSLTTSSIAKGHTEEVFDLLECGPRNRFVVLTEHGPIISHNCGYGGWVGAWKNFGGPGTDEEIKSRIISWREASPHIVNFWGGQFWRDEYGRRHEMHFGLEGALLEAVENPGVMYNVLRADSSPTGIGFCYEGDTLIMHTPGGARMTYHRPRLFPQEQSWRGLGISYEGWNTNPKNGGYGWITKELYAGRIAENAVQHVARNIQMHAIENLEAAGYPVVMHTYDEVVCEVPENFGSVTELESLMTTLPAWAKDWPIKAAGGWEARNYRKG